MKRRLFVLFFALALVAPSLRAADKTVDPIVSRIEREPVESSGIATVGYSKKLRALEIEFMNGAVYRYLGVAPSVHRGLMSASSKARFFHAKIRSRYRSIYVRPRLAENRQVTLVRLVR